MGVGLGLGLGLAPEGRSSSREEMQGHILLGHGV